eukprot:319985_1
MEGISDPSMVVDTLYIQCNVYCILCHLTYLHTIMSVDEAICSKFNTLADNKQQLLLNVVEMLENDEDDEIFTMNASLLKFKQQEIPKLRILLDAKIIIKNLNKPHVKNGDIEKVLLAASYPKGCNIPRAIYQDWPRNTVSLEMLKKKNINSQVIFELDVSKKGKNSVANNPEILKEYERRSTFIETLQILQNCTKEKTIKAAKQISIDELVSILAGDKWNNEKSKVQIRCADIMQALHSLQRQINKCKDLKRNVQFRMINILKIAKKGENGSIVASKKKILWNVEIKAPSMFKDYCDLIDKISDSHEDLEQMKQILDETKVNLIGRTLVTSQTFHSLATQGKYKRLKDTNRRKRVHIMKMKKMFNKFDLQVLCWMYKDWDIKFVKVEYKRGQKPVYLDMKKYIDKRVFVYQTSGHLSCKFSYSMYNFC